MRYRADILTLYGHLFDDAHSALTKEAGVFDRIGRWLAAPRRARLAEEALAKSEGQVGRLEQAAEDAAHRMALMEHDIAAARAAEQRAQQQATSYAQDIGQLGAAPGQIGRYRALATGGALLGAGGLAAAPLAYSAAQRRGEEQRKRTRNIAFGAGAATGLAAPQLIRGLGQIAQGVGQTGLYPELQGYGYPGTEGGTY